MAAKKPVAPASTSTKVARAKVDLPANVADVMAQAVSALANQLAAPTGKAIQVTQSKEFRFPDNTTVKSFKGIIVSFASHNAYYEGDFDRDNIVPPNCFAIGTVKNDDLECSPNSPDPQPEEGSACKTCWANQWKSAAKGAGKACKNSIKLAILCDDGEIRPMGLSSTALKPFGEYVRDVVQSFGTAPFAVMTEFTFDPKSDFSSVRCGNPIKLNNDQLAQVLSMRDDAAAMIAVEPDVSEFEAKVVEARAKPAKVVKPPVRTAKK
jgi:hypothetical protein